MYFCVLAKSFNEFASTPDHLPTRADLLTWIQKMDPGTAALFIVLGLVLLLFGFQMHRALISLTATMLGAYLGYGLGDRAGLPLAGMVVVAIMFGAAAWVWTNLVAALVAAICGALLGSAVWQMADLNPQYAWSGALTGAVTLGLLSFILFRISVILFTSLQGAIMLVIGGMGMAWYYDAARDFLQHRMNAWPVILPATVLVLTLIGFTFQHMKGPSGGGGGRKSGRGAKASAGKAEE